MKVLKIIWNKVKWRQGITANLQRIKDDKSHIFTSELSLGIVWVIVLWNSYVVSRTIRITHFKSTTGCCLFSAKRYNAGRKIILSKRTIRMIPSKSPTCCLFYAEECRLEVIKYFQKGRINYKWKDAELTENNMLKRLFLKYTPSGTLYQDGKTVYFIYSLDTFRWLSMRQDL